jgi:hypothetical protein
LNFVHLIVQYICWANRIICVAINWINMHFRSKTIVMVILFICYVSPSNGYSARRLFRQWIRSQQENIFQSKLEDLTCWTCQNQTNNEACNNWAPDVQCPIGHSICKSVHRIDTVTMETRVISKMCSPSDGCSVGCHDITEDTVNTRECVSCCSDSYCNEAIPTDSMSAITLSLAPFTSTSSLVVSSLQFVMSSLALNHYIQHMIL